MSVNWVESLFLIISLVGVAAALSSTHWFGVWFGLELNLVGFMPLMAGSRSPSEMESCVKYFLSQGVGSGLLMFGALGGWVTGGSMEVTAPFMCMNLWGVLVVGLFLKLGVAPFHFWVAGAMSGVSWGVCFLLSSVQKAGPLFCLGYITTNKSILIWVGGLSALVGGVGGCFQTRMRPLLGYSSVSHMGWCLGAMGDSVACASYYFLWYLISVAGIFAILKEMEVYSMKAIFSSGLSGKWLLLSLMLLSLSGLPPFAIFFGKVSVILSVFYIAPGAVVPFLLGSGVSLYFYIKLIFTSWAIGGVSQQHVSVTSSSQSVSWFLSLCFLSSAVVLW